VDLEALSITLAEIASAMAYLHAHRIAHRDLKPKNILLCESNKDRRAFVAKVRGRYVSFFIRCCARVGDL
jgi:serine/threonine protein kinase